MKKVLLYIVLLFQIILFSCSEKKGTLSGELKRWHTITLTFNGPNTGEDAVPNPFLDYRLNVVFTHDTLKYIVPGFYAADGNSSETSGTSGSKWQVRFTPPEEGIWEYAVSFRHGKNIAVSDDPREGKPLFFDGETGSFKVGTTDKTGNDFRTKGRLQYVGKRYLQFAGTGTYFLKGGADSPENFLGYADFDGTSSKRGTEQREGEANPENNLHQYQAHLKDWKEGDPEWKNGKGKAIIGALNYLESEGMNSVYFLTMNINGDGKDVWPYTNYNERLRFDCSKLDQWEKVFSYMDKLGIMLHIVTQETENELLLDNGDTGLERKLYYRELIARFSHHLAVTWNMGEENGYADFTPKAQNTEQRKAMISYIKSHDPYHNFIVLHTHSAAKYRYPILNALLGFPYLDGPSLQIGNIKDVHMETLTWIARSGKAGKQWVVDLDEIGPASRGVDPDDRPFNNQDSVRHFALWGNLMAGGGGVEWYFGYQNHDNDLNCENWRSRDKMWDYTRYAISFFQQYLPFSEMESADSLTSDTDDYCFAKPDAIYAIYLPKGGNVTIDLRHASGNYQIYWYDPRHGGELQQGSVKSVEGGILQNTGFPPESKQLDWVVLLKKSGSDLPG